MIQFYKLNSRNSGGACSFYYNKKDDSFFSQLLGQATWDAKKNRGTCDKDKQITIKLSPQEISDFIHAIETNDKLSGYHKSMNNVTTFSFNFSEKNNKSGFWYSAQQTAKEDSTQKTEISVPFYSNEAFLLKKHLEHLLNQSFMVQDEKYEQKQKQYESKHSHSPPKEEAVTEEEPW